jgi:exocyst complex protein 7
MSMALTLVVDEEATTITKLEQSCSNLKTLLQTSTKMEVILDQMDNKFQTIDKSLSIASRRLAPIHSLAITNKALETRINRAVSPAFALLESFKHSESLNQKLLHLSSELSSSSVSKLKRLKKLLKYVDCVEKLNDAINSISEDGEAVIQKLQGVVEFLSRTKAVDQYRTHRLTETLFTLKALYETEVDAMKYEGLFDKALLNLQDEFEKILRHLKHRNIGDDDEGTGSDLGSELEVHVLQRISETLAANDCLDICVDIFVKVRYERAAKALMRLNPTYLKTYTPEEIDDMGWESLETSISLWIKHFELAVKTVFLSEKNLCNQVLANITEYGLLWLECFAKIADKIMAVFFRFGEGVARSNKEPQKLFKLLDMFECLENIQTEFVEVFEGEAGVGICTRFRELEKLLVHASSKVFWEFGFEIESNSDGFPLPQDGSVQKLVRYAINYLKFLATEVYSSVMGKVLRTEKIWKSGVFTKLDSDENLLKESILNIMEALERNIETKRSRYKDKVMQHVFTMNTYWYIYMRTRNTELGQLLGEQHMKKKYKVVAEESAYLYQRMTWGSLVRLVDVEEILRLGNDNAMEVIVKSGMDGFFKGFNEIAERHRGFYLIPDIDLREQMREAALKLVVPAYSEFLNAYSGFLEADSYLSPESEIIEGLIGKVFDGGDVNLKRRDSKILLTGGRSSAAASKIENFRRSRSNISDL